MKKIKQIFSSKSGEGYIDYILGIFCIMLVVGFVVNLMPIFTAKQQLDIFATEIVREAEIKGNTSVSSRINTLKEQTNLDPNIEWDCDYYSGNKVQLNGDITVTLTETINIGFFSFGSFPVEITAKSTGKSEVYYK